MALERTLVVLFALTGPALFDSELSTVITHDYGFRIIAQRRAVAEELEEVGIEMRLDADEREQDEEEEHLILVLERNDAVRVWKERAGIVGYGGELDRNCLNHRFPTLKFHSSPSLSVAQMSISTLFPSLSLSPSPRLTPLAQSTSSLSVSLSPSPSPSPSPSLSLSVPHSPHVPFALSNASHPTPIQWEKERQKSLSPRIERALRDLEREEEQRERGGRGEENNGVERRVFSYKPEEEEEEEDGQEEEEENGEVEVEYEDDLEGELVGDVGGDGEFEEEYEDEEREADSDRNSVHSEEEEQGSKFSREAEGEQYLAEGEEDGEGAEEQALEDLEAFSIEEEEERYGLSHEEEDEDATLNHSAEPTPSLTTCSTSAGRSRTLSSTTNTSTTTSTSISTASSYPSSHTTPTFHARPLPSSHHNPSITPRLTKAAALRLGIIIPPRTPPSTSTSTSLVDEDPSATPRAATRNYPRPKSLAAPMIAPRTTRTSALRTSGVPPPSSSSLENGDGMKTLQRGRRPPSVLPREALSTAERNSRSAISLGKARGRESIGGVGPAAKPPKIEVRMTKGSALRTGAELPSTGGVARRRESLAALVESGRMNDVSGGKGNGNGSTTSEVSGVSASRRESIVVKSIAPPRITPRGTRASLLRGGTDDRASSSPTSHSMSRYHNRSLGSLEEGDLEGDEAEQMEKKERNAILFEGVPGFKRRESIQVASTAKPVWEPRLTKAAALRLGVQAPAGSEAAGKRRSSFIPVDFVGVPGHRRRDSIPVASSRPPVIAPRLNRSTLLRQGLPSTATPSHRSVPYHSAISLSPPRPSSSLTFRTTTQTEPLRRRASSVQSHASVTTTGSGSGASLVDQNKRRSSIAVGGARNDGGGKQMSAKENQAIKSSAGAGGKRWAN